MTEQVNMMDFVTEVKEPERSPDRSKARARLPEARLKRRRVKRAGKQTLLQKRLKKVYAQYKIATTNTQFSNKKGVGSA